MYLGRSTEGLDVVGEAVELVPSDVASVLAPQFAVLRGELLVAIGDIRGAVLSYETAASLAHLSGARMNELQAAVALVHLSNDTDRRAAVERLHAVYETFSEGYDAPDVVEARRLIGA